MEHLPSPTAVMWKFLLLPEEAVEGVVMVQAVAEADIHIMLVLPLQQEIKQ
jgi:hypothetical protein